MTTDEIIEVPGSNDWTLGLSFEGFQVEFRWRELSYQGRSMDHWAKLVDPATGEDLRFDGGDYWKEQAIRDTVATFRVAQLRNELQLANSIPFMTDREARKTLLLELFERSERGEYLGQRGTHQFFFVQDVAAIFAMDQGEALGLVDELSAEGKLGLNGMILIPHEDQEDAFESWEKSTGHRRITVGDFGNWGCSACGQWGDEYDNPRDFECKAPSVADQLLAAGGTVVDLSEGERGELDPLKITPSDPSAEPAAPKYPAIALPGAQPKVVEGQSTDGCECICHRIAGISHIRACCNGTSAVVADEEEPIEDEGEQR